MLKQSLVLGAGIACAGPAMAVDFGVMETADVVTPGEFKFIAFPLAVRHDHPRREQDAGIAMGAGYGLFRDVDVELQVGAYDGITYFGADAEYAYGAFHALDLSVGGGAHHADSGFGNPWGVDFTHIASYTVPALPRLRFTGALDLAYEYADERFAAALATSDDHYWTAYAVPGAQYRITRNLDLIGEFGFGLNGDSDEYAAAGISYYFRR
jgi:hypothetical protein